MEKRGFVADRCPSFGLLSKQKAVFFKKDLLRTDAQHMILLVEEFHCGLSFIVKGHPLSSTGPKTASSSGDFGKTKISSSAISNLKP